MSDPSFGVLEREVMSDEGDDNFLALVIGESLKVLSVAVRKKIVVIQAVLLFPSSNA